MTLKRFYPLTASFQISDFNAFFQPNEIWTKDINFFFFKNILFRSRILALNNFSLFFIGLIKNEDKKQNPPPHTSIEVSEA